MVPGTVRAAAEQHRRPSGDGARHSPGCCRAAQAAMLCPVAAQCSLGISGLVGRPLMGHHAAWVLCRAAQPTCHLWWPGAACRFRACHGSSLGWNQVTCSLQFCRGEQTGCGCLMQPLDFRARLAEFFWSDNRHLTIFQSSTGSGAAWLQQPGAALRISVLAGSFSVGHQAAQSFAEQNRLAA